MLLRLKSRRSNQRNHKPIRRLQLRSSQKRLQLLDGIHPRIRRRRRTQKKTTNPPKLPPHPSPRHHQRYAFHRRRPNEPTPLQQKRHQIQTQHHRRRQRSLQFRQPRRSPQQRLLRPWRRHPKKGLRSSNSKILKPFQRPHIQYSLAHNSPAFPIQSMVRPRNGYPHPRRGRRR